MSTQAGTVGHAPCGALGLVVRVQAGTSYLLAEPRRDGLLLR